LNLHLGLPAFNTYFAFGVHIHFSQVAQQAAEQAAEQIHEFHRNAITKQSFTALVR
jgi:hypothetical protein